MGPTNHQRPRLVHSVGRRARALARRRKSSPSEASTIDGFHQLYYDLGEHGEDTWCNTRWFGVKAYKSPLDLWIYQEILYETRPDLIIETGTANGGSALFLAMICELMGVGDVVSVDVTSRAERPVHDRIRYLQGSSVESEILTQISDIVRDHERVMVLLDSDHSRDHVLQELEAYAPFVTEGCYLVAEDTNVNGHPVQPSFGPGPFEAVEQFLENHPEFERDHRREKHLLTFNPGGYLRRKSPFGAAPGGLGTLPN
jgi:cephalosporin hydroxylase